MTIVTGGIATIDAAMFGTPRGANLFTILPLIIFLLIITAVHASALTVTGKTISARDGITVVEANLRVSGLDLRVRSDLQGHFRLELPSRGTYEITVTHVAFEKRVFVLEVGDTPLEITIKLEPRTYISDDIVVTGTRTPYLLKDVPVTTEVIRVEEAIATGATTIDQALQSAVGVTVDHNLGGAGVSLRGLDPARVLVLLDGEKVVGRVRGTIDMAQLSLANVERIEVVKGTGSTLYGSDAIGGVVNVITRKPQSLLRIYSSAEYGTFGTYAQILEAETRRGDWGLQLGARFDRTDGFDLTENDAETIGMERIKRLNLGAKVTRRLSRSWNARFDYNFFTENKTWIEADTAEGTRIFDDEESNYRYDGSARLSFQPSPKTLVNFNLYGTYYDHLWTKDFVAWFQQPAQAKMSAQPRVDEVRTEDVLGEASIVATHSYSEGHVITMGGDIVYQSLLSEDVPDGKQSIRNGDIYLQYEWKPLENFTLLPGIRREQHSTYGEHLNASLNVMYNPHPRVRVRGFHGGGFRAPSIKEIYFDFDHSAAGYRVNGGGEALEPEKSRNSSLTVEYSYAGRGLHRLTYFYNDINDLIDFDLVDASNPSYPLGIYAYTNVFRAYTTGAEWQSQIRLNDHFDLAVAYTYLRARNLENGAPLLNRPEHSVKGSISYRISRFGMTITGWGSWYSRKLWAPRNAQNLWTSDIWAPSQQDLNLSVVKRFSEALEAFGRVENIANDVEVDYRYWPGRRYTAGIRFTLDKQN